MWKEWFKKKTGVEITEIDEAYKWKEWFKKKTGVEITEIDEVYKRSNSNQNGKTTDN